MARDAKFWRGVAKRYLDRLDGIRCIIEDVETRCMEVDGPVTPTLQEMTEPEMRRIYRLANVNRIVPMRKK